MIVATSGGELEGGVHVRRSRAGAVGLAAGAALAAGLLAGCGGTPLAQPPPQDGAASSSSVYDDPGQLWPDATRTVVTTPKGQRPPLPALGEYEEIDLRTYAEQNGRTFEQARLEQFDVDQFYALVDRLKPVLGDKFSDARPAMDGQPAWVGLTGDVPPELVPVAEESYLAVELRGGALLSEAEAEAVRSAGTDAFGALTPEGVGWGGGLDTPSATFTYGGFAAEAWQPGDDVRAAVVAAATRALGRHAPFRVVLEPDDRDPKTTEPAVWFLPAGFAPDPTATSVEVLVQAQGCTSGKGAADRMAPPQVEVTDSQVRIAVSTYILKGPQTCQGHGTAPLVVDLGQPLGDRTLVDVNGAIDDGNAGPGEGLVAPSAG